MRIVEVEGGVKVNMTVHKYQDWYFDKHKRWTKVAIPGQCFTLFTNLSISIDGIKNSRLLFRFFPEILELAHPDLLISYIIYRHL